MTAPGSASCRKQVRGGGVTGSAAGGARARAGAGRRAGPGGGPALAPAAAAAPGSAPAAAATIAPPSRAGGAHTARIVAAVSARGRPGGGRVVARCGRRPNGRASRRCCWCSTPPSPAAASGCGCCCPSARSGPAAGSRATASSSPHRPLARAAQGRPPAARLPRRPPRAPRPGGGRHRRDPDPERPGGDLRAQPPAPPGRLPRAWSLPLTALSKRSCAASAAAPAGSRSTAAAAPAYRDPLGSAASHGCIRIDNRTVRWLAAHARPAPRCGSSAESPSRSAAQPRRAGTCWVMQWMLPPPSRISRAGDADHLAARGSSARRIAAGLARRGARRAAGRRRGALAEVEVHVGGGEAVAGRGAAWCPAPASTPAASSALIVSGPGEGSMTTSKRRPRASVAASSRRSASSEIACWGSDSSSLQVSRTTPGRTKQARLSTWPSVSSSKTPRPSQTTFSAPR